MTSLLNRAFVGGATGLALLFCATPAPSQTPPVAAPVALQAPTELLKLLGLREATIQDLVLPPMNGQAFDVRVVLGGVPRTLSLHAYDVRAHDFQLLVHDERGLHQVPTPASVTYRGEVAGVADTVVAASLIEGQLSAVIRFGEQSIWSVEPLSKWYPTVPRTSHVVFDGAKLNLPDDLRCGVTDAHVKGHGGAGSGPAAVVLAEIACDADYEYYQRHGNNVASTQSTVTTTVNGMDVIYQRDVQVKYTITTIIVRTTAIYGSTTNMETRLTQFQNYWNGNHGGVRRDLAHLFTGIGSFSGVIGIAYLGTVCNLGYAYGVSKAYSSNYYNVGLVSHECGHNWSAPHCSGSACYIMCAGLGGCGGRVDQFGTSERSYITSYASRAGCLDPYNPNPPRLTNVAPNSAEALQGVTGQTITLTGQFLTGATRVALGSQNVAGFRVVSDTSITFPAPNGAALGAVSVNVTNGAGTSNSLNFTYTKTDPPREIAPTIALGGFALNVDFGADTNQNWYMLISINDESTFPFLGYDILLNHVLGGSGAVDAAGLGRWSITPPAGFPGTVLHTQTVFLADSPPSFGGATNIGRTTFFL